MANTLNRYYIEVSYDAGLNYAVLRRGNDLEFLEQIGDSLDAQHLRWVIKDTHHNDVIVQFCAIHHEILDFVKGLQP